MLTAFPFVRTSAELAAAYGVVASEGAVRADRHGASMGTAGTQAMRELRAVARAGMEGAPLRYAVDRILAAYTARITHLVDRALRVEGAWAEDALWGIWDNFRLSPLFGGLRLQEGLQEGLLEAGGRKPSKTRRYTDIIRSGDWQERMQKWSTKIRKFDPVAETIARGLAHNANLDTIAKNILPYVQGYVSSAMRIVRTETARVHNEIAEETFKEHANQISGFQILSQLDNRVRPAHAARHGRIYKKGRPRPRLPDAPNCRCYYAPVLKKDAEGFESASFSTTTYDRWFSEQTDDVKIKIVGRARWNAIKAKGIRKPKWADFSNLKNGDLLSLDTIKRFTKKTIRKRRNKR